MLNKHNLLVSILILVIIRAAADQNPHSPSQSVCIASDTPIYKPGENGVIPPMPDRKNKGVKVKRGTALFRLLVNADGKVCDVKTEHADPATVNLKEAEQTLKEWTFKPATKDGKPVAVVFQLNMSSAR